jgi:hypothetical protein
MGANLHKVIQNFHNLVVQQMVWLLSSHYQTNDRLKRRLSRSEQSGHNPTQIKYSPTLGMSLRQDVR